jgi:hypothetical protein
LPISVAGGLRSGVTYVLDGAMHNDTYDNLNLPFPFPDALQEFRVATSGLGAKTARTRGNRERRGRSPERTAGRETHSSFCAITGSTPRITSRPSAPTAASLTMA